MKNKIKQLQLLFVASLGVAIIFALLSEAGLIGTDYIGNDPKVLYWVNLYSIISGLGGMFVTLRWFNFKKIHRAVCHADAEAGFENFCSWTKIRLFLLAFVFVTNVVLYFASSYTATPKYSMLIVLVAYVFCWPSKSAFQAIRESEVR